MNYKNDVLAYLIANQSLEINSGTKVYIKYKTKDAIPLIELLISKISEKGGVVFPYYYDKELESFRMKALMNQHIPSMLEQISFENSFFDVFVSIGSNDTFTKFSSNNEETIQKLKIKKQGLENLKNNKQWLLLNYPSKIDAQRLEMSYEEYYKYAMDAMTFDFTELNDCVNELKQLLDTTSVIRIIGDNVDLTFDKKNITAIPLLGNVNLPDGEIYTSPLRNSVNGYIKFNVPSPKENFIFHDIELVFKDGKIVDFYCKDHLKEFERIINIDENSKYIGEFAFGFNPMIKKPMCDILYDEKINKSFHFALGNSYLNAFNGNVSALHWDLIYLNNSNNLCMMYFDNRLVYCDGEFLDSKIKKLSKEY